AFTSRLRTLRGLALSRLGALGRLGALSGGPFGRCGWFVDKKVLALGPRLDRGCHPPRLSPAAGPGVAGFVPVFGRDLTACSRAFACSWLTPCAALLVARQGRQLRPEGGCLSRERSCDLVAKFQKILN